MSLPESNVTSIQTPGYEQGCGNGQGQGRGRHNSGHRNGSQNKRNNSNHQKWNNSETRLEKMVESQSKHACENAYYRCGMK